MRCLSSGYYHNPSIDQELIESDCCVPNMPATTRTRGSIKYRSKPVSQISTDLADSKGYETIFDG